MKKICFLVDSIYSLGGIQRIVTEMANRLYNNYDITIICQEKTPNDRKYNYNLNHSINVQIIDNSYYFIDKIITTPIRIIRYMIRKLKIKNKYSNKILHYDYNYFKRKKLVKYFHSNNFDYILGEGISNCILLSKICDKINSKVIGCWHSSYNNYLRDNSEEDVVNSLKKIETIVLSEHDADIIKKKYNINVKCVYNFISNQKVIKSSLKHKNFVAVGRYSSIKGYDRLIQIFDKSNLKDWSLIIVGDGPERRNLQSIIDKLKLNDRVKLIGGTNNVEKYYHEGSIFLMTSYGEGFPMVILEAMKYGLPIIAFDIPVLYEMLPNDKYIIKQNDFSSYIKAMKELSNDYGLRKKIGNTNSKKCEEFYDDIILKKWEEILK